MSLGAFTREQADTLTMDDLTMDDRFELEFEGRRWPLRLRQYGDAIIEALGVPEPPPGR